MQDMLGGEDLPAASGDLEDDDIGDYLDELVQPDLAGTPSATAQSREVEGLASLKLSAAGDADATLTQPTSP